MKTNLKNYYLLAAGKTQIVLAESIKTVRAAFPAAAVIYAGTITKNEMFLGVSRIRGREIAPGVYVNRLYE